MQRSFLVGIVLAAACGRMSFDEQTLAPDATGTDPPAGENTIACDQPTRFQVGAASVATMTAVATASGFAVFTVDAANALRGWAFEWRNDVLEAVAQNVALDTGATGTMGAASNGSNLLLASVEGVPIPTGTKLYPLDGSLAARGPVVPQAMIAGDVPLAKHASSDELVMIQAGAALDAHRLTPLGAVIDTKQIVAAAENPSASMVTASHTGFVASWVTSAPTPNRGRVELLDANLAVVAGPVTIGSSAYDAINPRVAWAPGSNTYLVAWYEKNPTDDDDVWFQVLDASLAPITPPTVLSTFSVGPSIVTDGTGFWVAWRNYQPEALQTARIAADGTVTPRAVAGSGGTPSLWTVVRRAGQSVLIWAEKGGSGPDLWIAAMCD